LLLAIVLVCAGCAGATEDPGRIQGVYDAAGKLQMLTYDNNADGKVDTWSHMDGSRIIQIDIDTDGDRVVDRWEYYTRDQHIEKVGSSSMRDGKVDAWAYYAADGSILKLERSRKRNDTVDRVEYYDKGTISRAEEDADGDGRMDKWETYAGTRLASVAFDTRHTGTPDRRLVYGPNGNVQLEVAPFKD
jgi:hypothetical protein